LSEYYAGGNTMQREDTVEQQVFGSMLAHNIDRHDFEAEAEQ